MPVTETSSATFWWSRTRGDDTRAWIQNYQTSLKARHRLILSKIIGELQPTTVLEIGSHCGPNLVRIALDHPHVKCAGLDPSQEAIVAGRDWMQSLGLSNRIGFTEGAFPDATMAMPSQSVDVVLTCYTLGYLSPEDVDAALFEIGRLAKKAVILAEPTAGEGRHTLGGYREWHHDYAGTQRWIQTLRGHRARRVAVSPPVDALQEILVLEV